MAAVYRGYYAMSNNPRVNSKGMNTSAALGFTIGLYDLLKNQRPTHIGVAFDLSKPTFRHEAYSEYKAHRDPMPEEIESNLPWICRIIDAFRIPRLTCEGFEADDVIGTLSHAAELAGFDEVVMVTPDKDFAQLVTPTVKMYRQGRGKTPDVLMGVKEVCEKYDVTNCRQVIDLLGLWGDAIDNIPGIPGVGEKTAKKLVAQFGSVEEMVRRVDEIKNDRLREKVRQNAQQALFSKMLATIRLDAPIAFDEQALVREEPDYEGLRAIFDELEFRQLARRIFTDLSVKDPQKAIEWNAAGGERKMERRRPAGKMEIGEKGVENGHLTLFDLAPSAQQAPDVQQASLSTAVLQNLKGKDVALLVDGPKLVMSTNADSVWVGKVGEVDMKLLADVLQDRQTTKLCFDLKNLKYILAELDIELRGEIFDVQLAHYLIDAEMRHSLDFICSALLGFEPPDSAAQAAALWQLYPRMVSKLKDAALERLYREVELPLVDVLMDMEKEGVRIDVNALKEYSHKLTAERSGIEEKIYRLAGARFNIGSPRQLGEVLYEKLKVTDKPPRTATKQYSTAEDVLAKLAASHPIIPLILEYRSVTKLLGTYLDSFPKLINPATGRLHTVYNQTVTATGRLSSSNPNLQNIPIRNEDGKEIRRAFIPEPGCEFFSADYSQIELRIMAHLSGDENLIEAFRSGEDIHAATAAKIYHVPLEEVTREQRSRAKTANFGIIYGISVFGLAERMNVSRAEAKELIENYFATYGGVKRYMDESILVAREKGYIETILHRKRYLPDINSRNSVVRGYAERNAINAPIQGSAADIIKIAMIEIYRRFRAEGLRSTMMLQVHDELNFSVYPDEKERVQQIVIEAMESAYRMQVPLRADFGWGTNWLEAH